MCFAGELGAHIDLRAIEQSGCSTEAELLFSESQSRILFEAPPERADALGELFEGLPLARIGAVVKGDAIRIDGLDGSEIVNMSRIDAKAAWKSTLNF
jgi:phosphoribosylformylglycinamidine (FGAM) synthase-like enzyme